MATTNRTKIIPSTAKRATPSGKTMVDLVKEHMKSGDKPVVTHAKTIKR